MSDRRASVSLLVIVHPSSRDGGIVGVRFANVHFAKKESARKLILMGVWLDLHG